jgi:hypothetical protein
MNVIMGGLNTEYPQTTDLQKQNELREPLHRLDHKSEERQAIVSTDLFHLQLETT